MAPDAVYWVGMPRAAAIRQEKVIDEDGNILEVVIWRVPATSRSPVGVRYRLAFIRKGEARPVVDQLLADFIEDVRRMTGEERWPRR